MTIRDIDLPGGLTVTIEEVGDPAAPAVLLVHGGAGPRSFAALAGALAGQAHVITPTHPGFDGRPRPAWFDSVPDLAGAYLDLLDALDLRDVLVVGNSIGGWIAAELGVRDNHGRVGGLLLLNGVGVRPQDPSEIVDIAGLSPEELGKLSFHDPSRRPTPPTPEAAQQIVANQRTLAVYGGDHYMHDPKLHHRLHRVTVPVLVGWGESDQVVVASYGQAYADLFPRGRFLLIPEAGHLPQLEQPARTAKVVATVLSRDVAAGTRG
jgi:pimeloyl-ACP methyl ester carboxylesterase